MSKNKRIKDLVSNISEELIATRALADVLWETSDTGLADDTRPTLSRMLVDRLTRTREGLSEIWAVLQETEENVTA